MARNGAHKSGTMIQRKNTSDTAKRHIKVRVKRKTKKIKAKAKAKKNK